jgi:uncharacterized protein (TIGR02145 family)
MKTFEELKNELLQFASKHNACDEGYNMGLEAKSKSGLVKAIVSNWMWVMGSIKKVDESYLRHNFTLEELASGGLYYRVKDIKRLSAFWQLSLLLPGLHTFDEAQGICPAGYRIPTKEEFEELVANTVYSFDKEKKCGVFTFKDGTKVEFPAAGYRTASDGLLNSVSSSGYYWSATPGSAYGYYLIFNSTNVSPSYNSGRANGFSVRCVKVEVYA